MPSKTQCAYLAGFIDGEGTLTVTRSIRKDRPGYERFNIRLAVYNTNLDGLEEIRRVFGGSLMIAERKEKNHKPQGQLVWSEKQIMPILEAVLPFLVIKKEQAKILLALQDTKMPATEGRRNGLSEESKKLREEAYKKLKTLNQRGLYAVENSKAS